MANDTGFRKFDSQDKYRICGARLTKDSEVRDGEHGKMVRLTFASESRKEAHSTLWCEANVSDWNSEMASFLRKGDVVLCIEGKPALRLWGDDNAKFSFCVERAEVAILPDMFATLKERGWTPGVKSTAKPATKSLARPAAKAAKPVAKPKKPVPIAIDDDETEIDEDDE